MTKKWDILALLSIFALGSISLLTISSVNKSLADNQLIFWAIGLVAFFISSHFDYRNWQKLSTVFYIFVILSLLLLIFVGDPVRGSVRWFDLGPFRIQPSELAKLSTILLLASFFSQRSAGNLKNAFVSFLLILSPTFLIFRQPDLGNALVIFAIWLGISFSAGFKFKYLLLLFALGLVLSLFEFEFLSDYQKSRLDTFINPTADPLGQGYNIIQAKIALGSGGFFGKGLGHGSQSQLNFLPEAESDFIFASLVEQLGFVGGSLIILVFSLLLTRIIKISRSKDRYATLIIAGVISFLTFQFLVNTGMNMGLLPVTGITLPLVSYGGSSLITTLFLLGIVFSIKRHQY